ncbi:MAG: hypothetical protein R3B07_28435 [Polyangiaceae bacterium]
MGKGHEQQLEATLALFSPTDFSAPSREVHFTVQGAFMRSAAWDPCGRIFFSTETLTDTAMFAVPTQTSGVGFRTGINTPPVGAVTFEPYTRTLIEPRDSQTSFALRAFALGGTAVAPTLTERTASSTSPWSPPGDLLPKQVEVEVPTTPVCP